MNTQLASDTEMVLSPEAVVVCTNLEQLVTAVVNSNYTTNAKFSFGRNNPPQGIVPSGINANSLEADPTGLPRGMNVHPPFALCFNPDLGTCWIEIGLGSKYPVSLVGVWQNGATTFLQRNLGRWFSILQLDPDNTFYNDHNACIRHMVFSV